MEVFGTLPVWVQLLIGFLAAGVLLVMNVGWLIQARGWLEQQRQKRTGASGTTGPARTGTPPPTGGTRSGSA